MHVLNEENQKDVRVITASDSERQDSSASDLHVVLYVRHQLLLRLRRYKSTTNSF